MSIRGGWVWGLLGVLAVSLGLNFFVGGMMFSHMKRGGSPSMGLFSVAGLEDLPSPMRRMVAKHMRGQHHTFHAQMDEVRELRREAVALMQETPLDEERIREKFTKIRDKMAIIQEKAQATLLDGVREMPAQERQPRR